MATLGAGPVALDEWQVVPEILGAIKRSVDDDPRPGRFVITGSSQADLTASVWQSTGRVIRLPLMGLVERELVGGVPGGSIIDRLAAGEGADLPVPTEARDAAQLGQVRDPARLRRYLQAVAANTAGVVVHETFFDAAGIDRGTGVRFDTLLEQVFVLDQVPAYSTNRLNR